MVWISKSGLKSFARMARRPWLLTETFRLVANANRKALIALSHVLGMALVMEKDIAFNPVRIGLFCSTAVMFETYFCDHLIKKF